MRDLGFCNLHALDFGRIFEVENSGVFLSLLRAGDFRDDSGLVLAHGDFTALLTVDSNRLNQFVLPERPSILLTAFAGGATGYPLCFDMYGQKQKDTIVTRNRNAMLSSVEEYVSACNPRAYMPYAGYFTERAPRDSYINSHNCKNGAADIIAYITRKHENLLGIDPTATNLVHWRGGAFTTATVPRPPLAVVDSDFVAHWISKIDVPQSGYDGKAVARYFAGSAFQDDLVLYLVPTDDDFVPLPEVDGLVVDFRGTNPVAGLSKAPDVDRQYELDAAVDSTDVRRKRIRVRAGSLMRVVYDGLPWEDILIGFQCRVHRTPDVYNSNFWFHFTNKYIGRKTAAPVTAL
jgi:CMP-N-acetylneuraminate monooxygenase